jgi:hypothetical protein
LEFQPAACIRPRVPVSLLDKPAYFGVNDIKRLSGVDPKEILHILPKL